MSAILARFWRTNHPVRGFPGTDDRVQPDLLFVSNERRAIIGEKQVLLRQECSIKGCRRIHHRNTFCDPHYEQYRKVVKALDEAGHASGATS